MEKKIYAEQTEYGQRIVIDYGDRQTWIDIEDGDKSGMGDDRIYVAHACKSGDLVDVARVTVTEDEYIIGAFLNGSIVEEYSTYIENIEDWDGDKE